MKYLYLGTLVLLTLAIKSGNWDDVDEVIMIGIPHSHTDAGWYWTYDSYYGQAAGILNSVFGVLTT